MTYRIERIGLEDWERLREVRLAQLLDAPDAFLETHEMALAHDDAEWKDRARRVNDPGSVGLVAVTGTPGEWVGTMVGFTPAPGTALLLGVWVAPEHRGRGRGVTDALLDAVLDWARDEAGAQRVVLTVHEGNARAIAYYRRRGFAFTGGEKPYALDPAARELEMVLPLA
ncbi:GNAT family N-acetyltransferase [Kitasatospora sp. NPDC058115]|uniref:GNAT family N-acetyltransferase n=1 Tax=Kitasatospora sp. NPDC058115 TaxID=3346347 RepID=UPI0036DF5476